MFCSATDSRVSGTQNFNKRAVSFSSGSQEGEDGSVRDLVSTLPSPSLFASGQQGPVRGRDAFSRIPCPTMEPGQCHTTHSDPTSRRTAFRVGPLCSISLPHRGYVSVSLGPACTVPGGLARAPQAVSLAPEDYQTRLRDSVRPASPQVQGHSVHLSVEQGCPCLACRSRGPTGEGRDRAGPSSRDEVRVLQPLLHRTQERRWVTTNPGPARSEPGPSQAPVQDVDAETHLSMRPSLRLVYSNRPEGHLLPCLDPPSTQTVSPLCVRGASIPVQGPSLRAIPVASCLHQGRRSSPCTVKGSRHSYPQLPRRLAHSGPVSSTVVRTQGYGAQSPQPVGTSGQPGKEQTLPYAEDLFSRHGVGLGQPHSTSLRGACSVNAEMPGVSPAQEGGSTETFSEAPGAYGILSRYHAARIASYETASALASRPGPEMGMAPRHIPGLTHPVLPSHLQPLVGPCDSSGRSQKHLRSLRAVHVPGELNRAADELSRQHALPGEWRLHPEVLQLIWRRFGDAQVDLFASPDTSHCQLFFSLSEGTLGTDALACSWPRGLRKYAFPPVSLLVQTLCKVREDEEQVLLVAPYWPNRTWFPELMILATAPPWQRGHPLAPAPRLVESPRMVLGRDAEVLSGLPPAVVNTIASARALSMRQAYRLKWNLFVDWRLEDPRRCPIAVVFSFLQDGLERRLYSSTLKVYVAVIAAHHDAVDGKSLGKHDLVIRFLRGARRLNPLRPHLVLSWDLPSVLSALRGAPFEPLQSVELKFLSLKTVLLSALATVKRLGDLQAFSVDDSCLEFGPADSHVVLRPRPGYVPKVPTMHFRDQVVNLQALPREEADPAIALLCPVRALRIYVDRTQSFRTSDQLFVCFGGQQKGRAVSKQRLAHWIVEAIVLAYQARRLPCPLGVRAHSTRGVASSWALARGASIADICKAAGWATPNTFARFYNLRIEPVSSRVLVSDGQ